MLERISSYRPPAIDTVFDCSCNSLSFANPAALLPGAVWSSGSSGHETGTSRVMSREASWSSQSTSHSASSGSSDSYLSSFLASSDRLSSALSSSMTTPCSSTSDLTCSPSSPTVSSASSDEGGWRRCQLSGQRLVDAVLAPDGKSYDRRVLLEFLAKQGGRLPSGGAKFSASHIWPDYGLRSALESEAQDTCFDGETPSYLLCSIGMDVMKDPVLASDGRTYELDTIRRIFRERQCRSPFTNEVFKSVVYRHLALQQAIRESGHEVSAGSAEPVMVSLLVRQAPNLLMGARRVLPWPSAEEWWEVNHRVLQRGICLSPAGAFLFLSCVLWSAVTGVVLFGGGVTALPALISIGGLFGVCLVGVAMGMGRITVGLWQYFVGRQHVNAAD